MNAETSVVTNKCDKGPKAQKWTFADNGQVGSIQNQYWGKGNQCLVGDNNTVIAEPCNDKSLLQAWYWVNVGDDSPCPTTADSRMKLPTQSQPRMKLPKPRLMTPGGFAKTICSFNPPGECTKDKNECGHPSVCGCPIAYSYNPATGQCDYAFEQMQTSGAQDSKDCNCNCGHTDPNCSFPAPGQCTSDMNECGKPSNCNCGINPAYQYNPATGNCDLDLR